MKRFLVISFFSLLCFNIAISNANSSTLNIDDRFGCRATGSTYILKILNKYSENYFLLEYKIRGTPRVGFAVLSDTSLESFWVDETNVLKVHMFNRDGDKYSDFIFLAEPTPAEVASLKFHVSKFSKLYNTKQMLTEDELQNEIKVHNHRLSIVTDIMGSEEKLKNQGLDAITSTCRKRKNY